MDNQQEHYENEGQQDQVYEQQEDNYEYQQYEEGEQVQEGNEDDNQEEDHQNNLVNINSERQLEDFQTPDNEGKQEHFQSETSQSKLSQRKSKNFSGSKNFVEMNLKVKTIKEIQNENSEKKRQRMSQLSDRKSHTQSWMSSRMSLNAIEDSNKNGLEWGKVVIKNQILDKEPKNIAYSKNMSNEFITKYQNQQAEQAKSLGQVFSQSRKEKAWHQTNASSINLLNSYKTLDMPNKDESSLVPKVLGNVELKQNLNLKSSLDNHNYVRNQELPSNYNSYQQKSQIVHNLNNNQVQNMRLKNYTSNVF